MGINRQSDPFKDPKILKKAERILRAAMKDPEKVREIEEDLRRKIQPLTDALDRSERLTAEDYATYINCKG